MIGTIKTSSSMAVIDRLLGNIKENAVSKGAKPCGMTIKDFDGLVGAVKAEIMLEGSNAIVTSLTGDVVGVLGWNKSDLVGEDLIDKLKIDKYSFKKAQQDLMQNGWAIKHNQFLGINGNTYNTISVLLWRDYGKSVVELIFRA